MGKYDDPENAPASPEHFAEYLRAAQPTLKDREQYGDAAVEKRRIWGVRKMLELYRLWKGSLSAVRQGLSAPEQAVAVELLREQWRAMDAHFGGEVEFAEFLAQLGRIVWEEPDSLLAHARLLGREDELVPRPPGAPGRNLSYRDKVIAAEVNRLIDDGWKRGDAYQKIADEVGSSVPKAGSITPEAVRKIYHQHRDDIDVKADRAFRQITRSVDASVKSGK